MVELSEVLKIISSSSKISQTGEEVLDNFYVRGNEGITNLDAPLK